MLSVSQSARMSKITNDGGLNPVWHQMLYSCNHMVTVGVKGLKRVAALYSVPFVELSVDEVLSLVS